MASQKRAAADTDTATTRKKRNTKPLDTASTHHFTRAMTTDAARQAVLGTNELLENIIIHLPAKNIFGIQRVSKQFKEVIATSPGIQEKVFLRLKGTVPESWVAERYQDASNPFPAYWRPAREGESALSRVPAVLNPNLSLVDPNLSLVDQSIAWVCRAGDYNEHVELPWETTKFAQHYSLFDKFICDPPCKSAFLSMHLGFDPDPSFHSSRYIWDKYSYTISSLRPGLQVHSETGLTLWDVFSEALKARGVWIKSSHRRDIDDEESTLSEAIHKKEQETGCSAIIDKHMFLLALDDVVVPSPAEWEAVHANLARGSANEAASGAK